MFLKKLTKCFQTYSKSSINPLIRISPEVQDALLNNKPVVSLESTIISHGMPYPDNYNCAIEIQNIVRSKNVVPATIALFDGFIHVGLDKKQLERLAYEGPNGKVRKVSRRDLAYCIYSKGTGATTVSGTMICSQMVGINIFVTGGIGGVHRNVQQTFDISADLTELGKTPVAVVCAGVKSILDINKTLQYLETQGVPVVSFKSEYFPAFYSASSGIKSPFNLQSQYEIAQLIKSNKDLNIRSGIVIGVPNPQEAESRIIEKAIQQSLIQMQERKIIGFQVTPFLLKRVKQKTGGLSLESNLALVKNNAKVGAQIALKFNEITESEKKIKSILSKKKISSRPIIIGGSAMDTYISALPEKQLLTSQSNAGLIKNTFGGVGRNICQVVGRLQQKPIFITPLTDDESGKQIKDYLSKIGVQVYNINSKKYSTARFMNVVKKNGDMLVGIADMEINKQLTFDAIYNTYFKDHVLQPYTIVSIDSNIPSNQLNKLISYLNDRKAIIFYECISSHCTRIIESNCLDQISLLKMNQTQEQIFNNKIKSMNLQVAQIIKTIGKNNQSNFFRQLLITRGENGISRYSITNDNITEIKYPIIKSKVVKTLGAGDTVTGSLIAFLSKQEKFQQALKLGICATKISLENPAIQSTIPSKLNIEEIYKIKKESIYS